MRFVDALAVGLVFAIAITTACHGATDVSLEVTVPSALVSKTRWFEVAAYKDASCASIVPMLLDGIPQGYTARVAFERRDDIPPRIGEIPGGNYAFAAVARDATCAVLARGCTTIGSSSSVTIDLETVEGARGRCGTGASCQAGRCVPANNNDDPSVGAGCSLELLGAGPLLHVATGGGTMSAPSIAPTDTGFVVAYRQNDPNNGDARLLLLPLDNGGGVYGADRRELEVEQQNVLASCSRDTETDGIGLVTQGANGMLAIANSCGDRGPNLELVTFTVEQLNSSGQLGATPLKVFVTDTATAATLGAARASALPTAGGLTVYTQGGVAKIARMVPSAANGGIVGPTGTFGGDGITDAWIAASDRLLALLAVGSGPVERAPSDAGPRGGGDSGEPTLRLVLLDGEKASDPASIRSTTTAAITFPGTWGSIATLNARAIVLSSGGGTGREVTYRAFDLGSDSAADTSGFTLDGDGDVTSGDATVVGNRAYFAVLKEGAIALHVYDNAATTLTPLNSVSFGRLPRISAIGNVGADGRVAVAATPSRVAVAWTTKKSLLENDPAGGYAVFACTQ